MTKERVYHSVTINYAAPIMSRPPSPSHLLLPFRRPSLDEAVSRLFEAGISSQKVAEDALGGGSTGPPPEMQRVRCKECEMKGMLDASCTSIREAICDPTV